MSFVKRLSLILVLVSAGLLCLGLILRISQSPETPASLAKDRPSAIQRGEGKNTRAIQQTGTEIRAAEGANSRVAKRRATSEKIRERPPVWPMVLQDFEGLPATPGQQKILEMVRLEFIREIGGENQFSGDSAYRERWSRAQRALDSRLKAQLGDAFIHRLQLQVGQNNETHPFSTRAEH